MNKSKIRIICDRQKIQVYCTSEPNYYDINESFTVDKLIKLITRKILII